MMDLAVSERPVNHDWILAGMLRRRGSDFPEFMFAPFKHI
jgi:hypothetical protein